MHNPHDPKVLPMRNGVSPSCIVLPSQVTGCMLDFLSQRLPAASRAQWHARMQAGEVVDEHGTAVFPERPVVPGLRLYYYRSLERETPIPFTAQVLFRDAHLLVADKPHFLPVVPAGRFLHNSLLVRLKSELGLPELSPIHRIDRETAGLVLFSVQRATRGLYQSMFRERAIDKTYEAVAAWREAMVFPREHASRMEESGHFFRMHEVVGEPNSFTRIEVIDQSGSWARYRLRPVTGRRHQLRVHMASLGLPLRGDTLYPEVNDAPEGDFSQPLQLLARSLAFCDPRSGERRYFESQRALAALPGEP